MPRVITQHERMNGMKYCTFCKPEKVDAVWRNKYRGSEDTLQFACHKHEHLLKDGSHTPEKLKEVRNCGKEDHFSEADYQTWLKLY